MYIRDIILKEKLLEPEPFIYPMSAIRQEEIFEYFMKKYVGITDRIVETGTYMGLSGIFLSQYANIVYTFDIKDFPEKYFIWDRFEKLSQKIEFILIKDDNEKRKIVEKMDNFDFIWIDGAHANGIHIDWDIFKNKGKKFLFHDYCPSKAKLNGKGLYDKVYTFIESIKPNAKVVDIKEPFIYLEF